MLSVAGKAALKGVGISGSLGGAETLFGKILVIFNGLTLQGFVVAYGDSRMDTYKDSLENMDIHDNVVKANRKK